MPQKSGGVHRDPGRAAQLPVAVLSGVCTHHSFYGDQHTNTDCAPQEVTSDPCDGGQSTNRSYLELIEAD